MKNHGLTNGLIFALVSILFTIILYLISAELLFSWWLQFIIGIGFTVFFMRRAGIQTREDQGGVISFREALKPTFLVYVVATLITTLFLYVMYEYIDPSLVDMTKEKSLEATEKMMHWFNAPADKIDEALDKVAERDFSPNILASLKNYLFGLIFGGLLAMIVSAIIKRKPPEPTLQ